MKHCFKTLNTVVPHLDYIMKICYIHKINSIIYNRGMITLSSRINYLRGNIIENKNNLQNIEHDKWLFL